MKTKEEIEGAIRSTLVVENKESYHFAVEKNMKIVDGEKQQEAIAFAKWRDGEGYKLHESGFLFKSPPVAGVQVFFTAEELYQ